ncbi:MAG: hypothetical protein EOO07_27755, partial [Chitinophagaceae bacterium]
PGMTVSSYLQLVQQGVMSGTLNPAFQPPTVNTPGVSNVLATVLDKKTGYVFPANPSSTHYTGFNANLASVNDYYPFGFGMADRKKAYSWSRFGFNGIEKDDEVYGDGNFQDYGMRMYDTRIGRFLSVDNLQGKYPFFAPYQFAANTPIMGIDKNGEEVYIVIDKVAMKYDEYLKLNNSSSLAKFYQHLHSTNEGGKMLTNFEGNATEDLYIMESNFVENVGAADKEYAKNILGAAIPSNISEMLVNKENGSMVGIDDLLSEYDLDDPVGKITWRSWEGFTVKNAKNENNFMNLNSGAEGYNDVTQAGYTVWHEIYAHLYLRKMGITNNNDQHQQIGDGGNIIH